MSARTDKIKAELEKQKAARLEAARKEQMLATALSKQERSDDTRRKILAGSWALERAEQSPEFHAEMQRELYRHWLVRDDDRALFGMEPLGDAEKSARGLITSEPKKRGRPPRAAASPALPSDMIASLSPADPAQASQSEAA